jgi:hypothetical protein
LARRRRLRRNADKLKGLLWALLGLLIFGGFGIAWHFLSGARVAIDTANNCPKSGPTAVHVVLIDKSDPISPQQAQRVRQYIDSVANAARPGTRFDLYVADNDSVNILKPVAQVCSSGRGSEANPLYENPTRIQRQFEDRFIGVLRGTLGKLLSASTADSSPILESIRAAAITSSEGAPDGVPLQMTLVSDLVQHSALNSHFRGETNFEDLSRKPAWRSLQAPLKGAHIYVLYLLRPTAAVQGKPIQNQGHQLFWKKAVRASGGEIGFEPI